VNTRKENRMNKYRTHLISSLTEEMKGKEIVVSGWVENIRDHGGVLFLDLRDKTETNYLLTFIIVSYQLIVKQKISCWL